MVKICRHLLDAITVEIKYLQASPWVASLQVPDLPVYGCAIPTVEGLRHVLRALGASNGTLSAFHLLECKIDVRALSGRTAIRRDMYRDSHDMCGPQGNVAWCGRICERNQFYT